MPQIIGIFLHYLSVTLTLKLNYKNIFKIIKNWFLCFCFFYKIFGDKCFQKIYDWMQNKISYWGYLIELAMLLYMFAANFAF